MSLVPPSGSTDTEDYWPTDAAVDPATGHVLVNEAQLQGPALLSGATLQRVATPARILLCDGAPEGLHVDEQGLFIARCGRLHSCLRLTSRGQPV